MVHDTGGTAVLVPVLAQGHASVEVTCCYPSGHLRHGVVLVRGGNIPRLKLSMRAGGVLSSGEFSGLVR